MWFARNIFAVSIRSFMAFLKLSLQCRYGLEFRDQTDLGTVILKHDLSQPKLLGILSPSVLLVESGAQVQQLDCSTDPPQTQTVVAEGQDLGDLTLSHCTEFKGEWLCICAEGCYRSSISCFDADTFQRKWKRDGAPPANLEVSAITSDGRCIYVADSGNACVQMFSLSDGQYLGRLLEGEGRGKPRCITWCGDFLVVGFIFGTMDRKTFTLVRVEFGEKET